MRSSIHKGMQNLNKNVCWAVFDGRNFRLVLDPWVPGAPDSIPKLNPRYIKRELSMVASLCLPSGLWNKQLILQLFPPDDASKILKILSPVSDREGKLFWCKSKNEIFTIRAVYESLMPTSRIDQV